MPVNISTKGEHNRRKQLSPSVVAGRLMAVEMKQQELELRLKRAEFYLMTTAVLSMDEHPDRPVNQRIPPLERAAAERSVIEALDFWRENL